MLQTLIKEMEHLEIKGVDTLHEEDLLELEVHQVLEGTTTPASGRGHHSWAEGGRIGYRTAGPVFGHDEPSEPILEFMQDQNIPFSDQVEGEGGILEQLVAKYIEAGFPPDEAEAMALQEFEQMAADSGQGEGIASLV